MVGEIFDNLRTGSDSSHETLAILLLASLQFAEAGSDQIAAMRSKHPAQLEEPLAMSAIANASTEN
jgi:hypothetical protein